METRINSIHEEGYSDNNRTLGVLFNYSTDGEFKESFIFIFNNKDDIYVFFNTMIDMLDYLLYSEKTMDRAYMEEEVFDSYYDAPYIQGKFSEILEWIEK